MSYEAGYRAGYDAAFTEIYAALNGDDHVEGCGTCRACGVMRAVIEDMISTVAKKMTTEEFLTFARILADMNAREPNSS